MQSPDRGSRARSKRPRGSCRRLPPAAQPESGPRVPDPLTEPIPLSEMAIKAPNTEAPAAEKPAPRRRLDIGSAASAPQNLIEAPVPNPSYRPATECQRTSAETPRPLRRPSVPSRVGCRTCGPENRLPRPHVPLPVVRTPSRTNGSATNGAASSSSGSQRREPERLRKRCYQRLCNKRFSPDLGGGDPPVAASTDRSGAS